MEGRRGEEREGMEQRRMKREKVRVGGGGIREHKQMAIVT